MTNYKEILRETLINCLCGMKRKAHGAQKPRHINRIVEVASTAQRSDSPAQAINQGFLRDSRVKSPGCVLMFNVNFIINLVLRLLLCPTAGSADAVYRTSARRLLTE